MGDPEASPRGGCFNDRDEGMKFCEFGTFWLEDILLLSHPLIDNEELNIAEGPGMSNKWEQSVLVELVVNQ